MSNFKNTAKPITDADLNSVQAGAGYLKFDGSKASLSTALRPQISRPSTSR